MPSRRNSCFSSSMTMRCFGSMTRVLWPMPDFGMTVTMDTDSPLRLLSCASTQAGFTGSSAEILLVLLHPQFSTDSQASEAIGSFCGAGGTGQASEANGRGERQWSRTAVGRREQTGHIHLGDDSSPCHAGRVVVATLEAAYVLSLLLDFSDGQLAIIHTRVRVNKDLPNMCLFRFAFGHHVPCVVKMLRNCSTTSVCSTMPP